MKPVEELRYLVLAVQREGNRILAAQLRPLGLTPSQAEVLRVLHDHQPLTLSALGHLLVCETTASPSRLVDRLVSQGLVQRATDPDDRRYVTLTLTPEGRGLERQVADAEDHLYGLLERLVAGERLDETVQLLRKVADEFPAGQALAHRRESSPPRPA
ncbi:MarR family winged helix-turn-helix transcriptional regulator [Spirillospora sp. CA-142024]|uniref:MarR family winged helix-turn-helix transcriptional regulator n=1 Tax=Spirillospora sp. CA-142024 TaxID=3240036 RepID=UPI003D8C0495